MNEPAPDNQKRVPRHKRFAALLWRERHIWFWPAIAGVLLGVVTTILLRQKLMAWLMAALASLAHGCQVMLDALAERH